MDKSNARRRAAAVSAKDLAKTDLSVLDPRKPLQGLTAKQEKSAQLFFSGLDKTEAYRRAFNVGRDTKSETVSRAATRLFSLSKVRARIKQLQDAQTKELTQDNKASREEILGAIIKMAYDVELKPADRLRALQTLGKVRGIDLFKTDGDDDTDTRTPEQVERELKSKLASLLTGGTSDE